MEKDLIFFMDTRTLEVLQFQFVPREISYNPTSEFVAIQTFARNNPRYHYTGSEDTVEFEIDWHCEEENREDVIKKCRWLEARSKNNGYKEDPPDMLFKWGNLFTTEDTWIIVAAPYKLSNFDKPYGMLPKQAYQNITLKRVTKTNTTYNQIQRIP